MVKKFSAHRTLPTLAILITSTFFVFTPIVNAHNLETSAKPPYVKITCPFEGADQFKVDCGMLTVPEDHSQPDGPTIRLAVAVFHALGSKPKPDPIIYLDGGPGIHTLDQAAYAFDSTFSGFARNRDFILFDQRGVGLSEPALDCPEISR